MVKMGVLGAHAFVYPNFGYRSIWLRNRDLVLPRKRDVLRARCTRKQSICTAHAARNSKTDNDRAYATRQWPVL